jgi:hypothetical protein
MSTSEIHMLLGKMDDLSKQITTTAVTGLQLRREDLQAQMAIMAPVDTPVRNRLKRIKGQGGAHDWYQLTPTTYAQGSFLGAGPAQTFFAAGGLPTLILPNLNRLSAPYKILGDLISVTWHDQAAGKTYTDIRANQMQTKMLNTALIEEWCILNGNATTAPLQFDGLDVIVTNTLNYATPAAYPEVTAGSIYLLQEYITLACQRISVNGGLARMAVYPYQIHTSLTNVILQNMMRVWGDRSALAAIGSGLSIKSYDFGWGELDLIRSRYCPNYSYGATIFILDDRTLDTVNNGNIIQMVDLEAINSVDLGLIATSWQTVVYEDTVLMVSCPNFQFKIINVTV